jgi:hypothetical protein
MDIRTYHHVSLMKATTIILSAVLNLLARNLSPTLREGGNAAELSAGKITANLSETELTEGWRKLQMKSKEDKTCITRIWETRNAHKT